MIQSSSSFKFLYKNNHDLLKIHGSTWTDVLITKFLIVKEAFPITNRFFNVYLELEKKKVKKENHLNYLKKPPMLLCPKLEYSNLKSYNM